MQMIANVSTGGIRMNTAKKHGSAVTMADFGQFHLSSSALVSGHSPSSPAMELLSRKKVKGQGMLKKINKVIRATKYSKCLDLL